MEETIGGDQPEESPEDKEMEEAPVNESSQDHQGGAAEEEDEHKQTRDERTKPEVHDQNAVQKSSQREQKLPSNILEKGIIYFFTRNRVSVEKAESVGDLQRTYFVLRPLPIGAKLGDGPIPDFENIRLFALPKKVFPKSHRDRFMAFVEKARTNIQDLKDNFFKGEEHETKTAGTRRTEPVTTVAEGVYAITRTENRTTHLAYATTIPSDLGEVQEDLGLRSQGSFIISVKNPERPGPASARLPQGPQYPRE